MNMNDRYNSTKYKTKRTKNLARTNVPKFNAHRWKSTMAKNKRQTRSKDKQPNKANSPGRAHRSKQRRINEELKMTSKASYSPHLETEEIASHSGTEHAVVATTTRLSRPTLSNNSPHTSITTTLPLQNQRKLSSQKTKNTKTTKPLILPTPTIGMPIQTSQPTLTTPLLTKLPYRTPMKQSLRLPTMTTSLKLMAQSSTKVPLTTPSSSSIPNTSLSPRPQPTPSSILTRLQNPALPMTVTQPTPPQPLLPRLTRTRRHLKSRP
jgi:hypothetical protein